MSGHSAFDFLGFNVRRYEKASDQTIQGSHPANPGTAPNGDSRLARIQRAGGHLRAQPHR